MRTVCPIPNDRHLVTQHIRTDLLNERVWLEFPLASGETAVLHFPASSTGRWAHMPEFRPMECEGSDDIILGPSA